MSFQIIDAGVSEALNVFQEACGDTRRLTVSQIMASYYRQPCMVIQDHDSRSAEALPGSVLVYKDRVSICLSDEGHLMVPHELVEVCGESESPVEGVLDGSRIYRPGGVLIYVFSDRRAEQIKKQDEAQMRNRRPRASIFAPYTGERKPWDFRCPEEAALAFSQLPTGFSKARVKEYLANHGVGAPPMHVPL